MYTTYVLQSLVDKTYYIGHCEDIDVRLKRHNDGKVKSTKSRKPWEVVYQESFLAKAEAYKRELQIKSFKGGNAFKKLIEK